MNPIYMLMVGVIRVSSIQIIGGEWQFCEHTNYGGAKTNLPPGNYKSIQDTGINNDTISSMKRVGASITLERKKLVVFDHADYRGEHKHLISRKEEMGTLFNNLIATEG